MTDKDHIDPKGYWIDPERNVRRLGDQDGEQEIIFQATQYSSKAEWERIYEAVVKALVGQRKEGERSVIQIIP